MAHDHQHLLVASATPQSPHLLYQCSIMETQAVKTSAEAKRLQKGDGEPILTCTQEDLKYARPRF